MSERWLSCAVSLTAVPHGERLARAITMMKYLIALPRGRSARTGGSTVAGSSTPTREASMHSAEQYSLTPAVPTRTCLVPGATCAPHRRHARSGGAFGADIETANAAGGAR